MFKFRTNVRKLPSFSLISKFAIAASMAAAFAAPASAVTISSVTVDGSNAMFPSFNATFPTAGGTFGFAVTDASPGPNFERYFGFSLTSPASAITSSVNMIGAFLSTFSASLYQVSNCTTASPWTCDLGTKVADFQTINAAVPQQVALGLTFLDPAPATYVIKVLATATGNATVSGNIDSQVPAPSVLGLLGIGLVGIAGLKRRRV